MDNQMMGGKCEGGHCACSCFHHKVTPLMVVLIALTFLLGNLGTLSESFVGMAWPILLGVAGLAKMFGRSCKCCTR